jgi:hypothetical protein
MYINTVGLRCYICTAEDFGRWAALINVFVSREIPIWSAVQRWLCYLAVGLKAEVNVPLDFDK